MAAELLASGARSVQVGSAVFVPYLCASLCSRQIYILQRVDCNTHTAFTSHARKASEECQLGQVRTGSWSFNTLSRHKCKRFHRLHLPHTVSPLQIGALSSTLSAARWASGLHPLSV